MLPLPVSELSVPGLIIGGLIGVPLGLLLAAFLFQVACGFCDIPIPRFLRALGIKVVALLASMLAAFGVGLGLGLIAVVSGMNPVAVEVLVWGLAIAVNAAVAAGCYTLFLRVRYDIALMIWLLESLMGVVLQIALFVILMYGLAWLGVFSAFK